MTELRYRKCDACQKQVAEEETDGTWVNVRALVGNLEAYNRLQEARELYGDEVALDHGDFCGLICLSNWASARASMKELNEG
jgi:hypothetical protein